MTPEQYELIEAIFSEVCELPPEERNARLDRRCGDDPLVRREVEAMLEADDDALGLSRPAWHGAGPTEIGSEASTSLSLSLPERIGRYRVLGERGRGGMGVVYEAEQDSPRRRVALKVVNTGVVSRELVARFHHEAEILGRLQHPGIAQIFEAGSIEAGDGGQPYFAMEFIEGEQLIAHATSHELDDEARLALFARICDAVQYAHQKGIIHRDLKPQNILVVESGTREIALAPRVDSQPKILDFGVARMEDAGAETKAQLTRAGQLVGTIAYMSPEQAGGDSRELDTRSDIYSLGVVLFELLTGTRPYELRHRTMAESVRVIQEEEPRRLASVDPRFRGDVDSIVAKCLEKEPQRRYRSAADLAEDIRCHLRHEPISARPPSAMNQLLRFARRHRALVGGVFATLLALLVGLIATLIFAIRAERNATRASENEMKARRQAYISNLTSVTVLADTDPHRAAELLARAPGGVRGWEWRHLEARLRRPLRRYHADVPTFGRYAFTPDGTRLVAALVDGRIAVWDVSSAKLVTVGEVLQGAEIRALVIPTEGRARVACGTDDGRVRVWDLDSDEWSETMNAEGPIHDVAWDRRGERMLIATSTSVRLRENGRVVRDHPFKPPRARPCDLGFSVSEDHFVAWTSVRSPRGTLHNAVCMWDVSTGEEFHHPETLDRGHPIDVNVHALAPSLGLSHDGSRLATEADARSVRICGTEAPAHDRDPALWVAPERYLRLRGHQHPVTTIKWTIDDTRLVTLSADETMRLWDAESGRMLDVLRSDAHRIGQSWSRPLAVAPDGSGVVYRLDGLPAFWDFSPPGATVALPDVSYVYYHAFSPDGGRLAAASSHSRNVAVIDPVGGKIVRTMKLETPTMGVVFLADGRLLATDWKRTSLFELATGARIPGPGRPLEERPLELRRGARVAPGKVISRNGRFVATGSRGQEPGPLVVREIASQTTILEIEGLYWGVAISPDGRLVAAGREYPGHVELWSLETKKLVRTLPGHSSHAYCVDFHPDGSRLASGGNDHTIRLWDTATWEQVIELRGHDSYVFSLSFSPDGTRLASGSGDLSLRIWDTVPRADRHREAITKPR